MTDEVIVLVTAGSDEEAATIARALVGERLAACVNIIPHVHSFFFWEGRTQEARETLLICKSRQSFLDMIVSRVKALHSYTVPEIIALPIIGGARDYLDWVKDAVVGK